MSALARFRTTAARLCGPLTPLGRAVLAIGALCWAAGWILGWRELLVVAAACLVGVAVGLLFTLGRVDLMVDIALLPPRLRVGKKAVIDLKVTNAGTRGMLPVRLEVPIGAAIEVVHVDRLSAGQVFEVVPPITIATNRRGVLAVGPASSVRGDPLGLVRREVVWTDVHELFIHPEISRLDGVTSGWLRDLEGRPTNDRSPSDVAFHTLHEYVPGDDRRHVHWRSSAKSPTGKLMVRQFIDNRRSHLAIMLDTNPAHFTDADEFEVAVAMAASLAVKAIADGHQTTCVGGMNAVNGHNPQTVLDGLARVELGVPTTTIGELALRAAPLLRNASVIGLVTGSGAPPADVQLAFAASGTLRSSCASRLRRAAGPGMRRTAETLVLSADSLDSFARVMRTLAQR